MTCSTCQSESAAGAQFCPVCGWPATRPAEGRVAAAVQQAAAALPATALPPAAPPHRAGVNWQEYSARLRTLLARAAGERTGLMAGAAVLAACLIVNLAGWIPLAWPPKLVNQFVGVLAPKTCGPLVRGIFFGFCSAGLAIISLLGSAAAAGAMFVFRKGLAKGLQKLLALLPGEAGFLAAPAVATGLFTMGWAGVAFHFFDRPGLVRDGLFPAWVGVLTWATARYDPDLQRLLAPFMATRDRLNVRVRMGLTAGLTWLLSVLLTDTVSAPVRDQLLVVAGTALGYVIMAPRKGLAGLKEAVESGGVSR